MTDAPIITPSRPNATLGAPEGRRAFYVGTFWFNGEHWYALRDADTGEAFRSPAIFWPDMPAHVALPDWE